MTGHELTLRPARPSDEAVVRIAHESLAADDDFDFAMGLQPDTDWADHLQMYDDVQHGRDLLESWVPATFLLAEMADEVVGRTSIRHELNDWLEQFGGHIGYAVLPEFRRRGFASEILRQSLVVARSVGVGRVLVTCDDGNVASARVIERNGGALENIVDDPDSSIRKRRYWID